ncbi:MAG: HU family DNA-binding protein [Gammaproteobacteria bacterium]
MNITKNYLAKKISKEIDIPFELSINFVNSFFNTQKKIIKHNDLKISKFGSFKLSITPKRIGRNPKTLKEYVIPKRKRVSFKISKHIKSILN